MESLSTAVFRDGMTSEK